MKRTIYRKMPLYSSKSDSQAFKLLCLFLLSCLTVLVAISEEKATGPATDGPEMGAFPGVSRELASFCSARPSLSIDLAPMIIHVKRNTSFNYKLYLFSHDNVFQTGQIVPRDNFKIHSFPVKHKRLSDFWPQGAADEAHNSHFDLRDFLSLVPIRPPTANDVSSKNPSEHDGNRSAATKRHRRRQKPPVMVAPSSTERPATRITFDVHGGDGLPGDESFAHHDVGLMPDAPMPEAAASSRTASNLNAHIQFDRDDQVAPLEPPGQPQVTGAQSFLKRRTVATAADSLEDPLPAQADDGTAQDFANWLMPVGSFSSFRVNTTYLVRKDFGQVAPQLIQMQVDSARFQVESWQVIQNGQTNSSSTSIVHTNSTTSHQSAEDHAFLSHKLLRDSDTRITSISQIYEDWITRNFYTIVYIQRRHHQRDGPSAASDTSERKGAARNETINASQSTYVTNRLIFRGSSIVLLGADQLDYDVKASAFITEKNGLHYYLEFLTTGKFYLCAIDWTKRPFKIIDSRQFPIKATRTQFDNEELLLCPPAVCHSSQPIDEIVNYGRLLWPSQQVLEALSPSTNEVNMRLIYQMVHQSHSKQSPRPRHAGELGGDEVDREVMLVPPVSSLIEAIRLGSSGLETKLHLRDWTWTLTKHHQTLSTAASTTGTTAATLLPASQTNRFALLFEQARRNDIKVSPDAYGFILAGHEIDASYRVFNELYLISSNHLITINYTMPNETVTSAHPIGDEYPGLSSNLLDPITAAYYDRNANQIYFFKGDRYVGFDYATKKPLEDFQMPPPLLNPYDHFHPHNQHQGESSSTAAGAHSSHINQQPIISSLPVVGILGRQLHVDAIYHDYQSDFVYIFSGMKFYTHRASEFKAGAFRTIEPLPPMRCINEHFLEGCHFDVAYPNQCRDESNRETNRLYGASGAPQSASKLRKTGELRSQQQAGEDDEGQVEKDNSSSIVASEEAGRPQGNDHFSREQQIKLRNIATRNGLIEFLFDNSMLSGAGAARATVEPLIEKLDRSMEQSSFQERIVVYLLMSMVVVTILVTLSMVVLLINWTRPKASQGSDTRSSDRTIEDQRRLSADLLNTISSGQRFQLNTASNQSLSAMTAAAAAPLPVRHSRRPVSRQSAAVVNQLARNMSHNLAAASQLTSPVDVARLHSNRRQSKVDSSVL